jgi:hypothetical protein
VTARAMRKVGAGSGFCTPLRSTISCGRTAAATDQQQTGRTAFAQHIASTLAPVQRDFACESIFQQSAGDFSSVDLHPPTDIPTAGQLRGVRTTCGRKDLLHSRIQRTTTVTETSEQHRSRMRCFSCLWRCILRAPFTPILSDDTCDNFLVQKCREARRASIYNLVGHRQNANAFHPVRELM